MSNKHWSSCHIPEILKGCQRACHRLYFVFFPNSEVWVIKYITEKKNQKPKKLAGVAWFLTHIKDCVLCHCDFTGVYLHIMHHHRLWNLTNSETHGSSHLKVKQNKPLVLRKNQILLILQVHKLNSGKSETEFSRSYSTSISSQPQVTNFKK